MTIRAEDAEHKIFAQNSAEEYVDMVIDRNYQEGDCVFLSSSEYPIYLNIQLDEVLGSSFVCLTDELCYHIPFGAAKWNRSPKAFEGARHYVLVKQASDDEKTRYRNLALNPNDQHMDVPCFPHASANTETRGEAVFAAQNAIDGILANHFHGEWPYSSWGINRQDDAQITVDFGQPITTDRIRLLTRADFPHDSWWTQVTVCFSDGSQFEWALTKTDRMQEKQFTPKTVTWVRVQNLIKAEDPSPFPALTQLEVYGTIGTTIRKREQQ
ncbi:MAG: carbohydrate-binding protein [Clostridia bacterium]|nr:carbohydrate-binding protein [Clostridia bacterium]